MKKIMILDTSIATSNKGDSIIMECVYDELAALLQESFIYTLPTHLSAFHFYQVWYNSYTVKNFASCDFKFVGGSNILAKNMLTHFPQWNVNIFNYQPLKGCILVGAGAGAGETSNRYTRNLYKKMMSHDYYHSVRDERSKEYVESLGLKAINTGCVTMWILTPEFCNQIPAKKSDNVVFTLNARSSADIADQKLIDILHKNYQSLSFWVQGDKDLSYLHKFRNTEDIEVIPPSINAYEAVLNRDNVEYIGVRLHGGIYAMRHQKRAIIIAIDERAREISKVNHLNCIEKKDIDQLDYMLNSSFYTRVAMPYKEIERWKNQFSERNND